MLRHRGDRGDLVRHLMMLKCRSGVQVVEVSDWYLVVEAASSEDTPEQKVRLVFDITSLQWVTTTLLDREPLNEGTRVLLEHSTPGWSGLGLPGLTSQLQPWRVLTALSPPSSQPLANLTMFWPTTTNSSSPSWPEDQWQRAMTGNACVSWPGCHLRTNTRLCGPTEKCCGCSEEPNLPQLLFSFYFWRRNLDWCNLRIAQESCQELLRIWAKLYQHR